MTETRDGSYVRTCARRGPRADCIRLSFVSRKYLRRYVITFLSDLNSARSKTKPFCITFRSLYRTTRKANTISRYQMRTRQRRLVNRLRIASHGKHKTPTVLWYRSRHGKRGETQSSTFRNDDHVDSRRRALPAMRPTTTRIQNFVLKRGLEWTKQIKY